MDTLIIVISILLIIIVLLQSDKAEGGSFTGNARSDLFSKRKERGSEFFITRMSAFLGIVFFVTCLIMSFL